MKIIWTTLLLSSLVVTAYAADNTLEYTQKKLANGDLESTYSSSDGTKLVQVQHKDGSVESHVTQEPVEDKESST